MPNLIGQRAVVVGAGIAGLAAARALSDFFEQVVILERDHLEQQVTPRGGVAQGKHPHALLVGGQLALTQLFPDFEQQLKNLGACAHSWQATRWEIGGYDPLPQRDLGLTVYCASRPAIELSLRRGLETNPNVTLRDRCRVEALTTSPDGSVNGVSYSSGTSGTESIAADIVIDASGRGVLTEKLFDSAGLAHPKTSAIGINIDYSTAIYKIPDDAPADWKVMLTGARIPQERNGGVITPIEGNRWMVTLSTRHPRTPPPASEAEFLEFARSLRTQTLHDAIQKAERISPISRFRFTGSVRTHWGLSETPPPGFLVAGDAACRFNPVFGQGMTVAANEALMLRELLHTAAAEGDPLRYLQLAYFKKLSAVLDAPWSAAIADFVYPETTGERPEAFAQSMKFAAGLLRLAVKDPDIHRLMIEVQQLVKPPSIYRDEQLRTRVENEIAEMAL